LKRNFLKFWGLLFVFTVSLFVLTSCTKGLPAPTNVHINEHGVLVWDSVENAKGYKVLINDTEYDTTTPSYDLIKLNLPVGIHTIKVKAISNSKDFQNSKYSESVSYEITVDGPKKLSAPTNVRIEGDNIVWSAVSGATSYQIVVDDIVKTTTSTSFALLQLGDLEGVLQIKVKALGSGYLASDLSASVKYVISLSTETFKNKIKLHLMQKYDYSEAEAVQFANDFVDEIVLKINEYAGLENAVYLELFQTFFDHFYDGSNLMTFLDSVVYSDLDNLDLAKLLRGAIIYFLTDEENTPNEKELEDYKKQYEMMISELETKIEEIQTEYNALLAEVEGTEIYALYTQRNALSEEILPIERYLFTDYYYDNLFDSLSYHTYYSALESYRAAIEWNIVDEQEMLENEYPWLLDLTSKMQTFIEKYNLRAELDSLFDSYPYEELNKIYNLHEREYEIGLILDYQKEIEYYQEQIVKLEERYEENQLYYQLMLELGDYLKENETAVLEALMVPIKLVRNGLSNNMEELYALISNPNITPYEIFELKNAFVESIFSFDVMPTQEEFDTFLGVVEDLGILALDFRTENFETLSDEYEILLSSLVNGFEYVSAIYVPMINVYKEVLLTSTSEDIEALMMVVSEEELLQIFTEIAQRIQNNPVIAENSAIIEDAFIDLIFNKGFDVIPFIFAYASGTDFDLVFDIWDILTLDQNITLGAFEEISIISDMTAFSFVFFRNAGINKSPFDIISMVDWSAFMNLTKEDFANTLELTKRIVKVLYFYNQELEPDKYLLTEEQFDEAFDMDLIGTIIAQLGDIAGQLGTMLNDLYNEGLFEQYTFENVILIASELSEFYETNDAKIDTLLDNLKTLLVDNPLYKEFYVEVTAEEIDEFERDMRNAFEIAKLVSEMDPEGISEHDLETILDFVDSQFPIEVIYEENLISNNEVNLDIYRYYVQDAFYELVYQGKLYSHVPGDGFFTVEDMVDLLENSLPVYDSESDMDTFTIIFPVQDGCYVKVYASGDRDYIYYSNTEIVLILQ
jgi:hypothetical protein